MNTKLFLLVAATALLTITLFASSAQANKQMDHHQQNQVSKHVNGNVEQEQPTAVLTVKLFSKSAEATMKDKQVEHPHQNHDQSPKHMNGNAEQEQVGHDNMTKDSGAAPRRPRACFWNRCS